MEIQVIPKVILVVMLKVMTTGGSWVGDCRWWEGGEGGWVDGEEGPGGGVVAAAAVVRQGAHSFTRLMMVCSC